MPASLQLRAQAEQERRKRAKSRPPAPPIWTPNPGPQTLAYFSPADELFYGGAGGGGKSHLLLGLAGTAHRASIVFRRIFPSLRDLIEKSREVYNRAGDNAARDSFNEQLHLWRLADRRQIEFGAIQYEQDKEKYRGRPHDLYAWDEVTEFTETQFRFVNAWNRSTVKSQRCRIVATGNPPTMADGRWVISYWAAWLDPKHPNPAAPGELRWYARVDDKDIECPAGGLPFEHKGETVIPRSRTFIPAKLDDNPYLKDTGYRAMLQSLPEPLRSQMLYGDFGLTVQDDPYQVIPTAWVQAAIARWQPYAGSLSAIGADIARGGQDKTTFAPRAGAWFDRLTKIPGAQTPDGQSVAQALVGVLAGRKARVNVDVIGIGASAYDFARQAGLDVVGVNFGEGAGAATDRSGRLQFRNVRAAAYWQFREALDPANGQGLALPDDPELVADLCAARWELSNGKITIESKEDIKARLGRSPDCADAVVLAWWGAAASATAEQWIGAIKPQAPAAGNLRRQILGR